MHLFYVGNMASLHSHPIIKALENYEARSAKAAPRTAAFWHREPWLARRLFLQGQVPGYGHADAMRNILSGLCGNKLRIASAAASIQLKEDMTRIRAFYLADDMPAGERGYCVKIVQADAVTGPRMRDEIALRRRLETFGTLTLPTIFDNFEEGNFIYLIEEIIIGRRFSIVRDADAYIKHGLTQMLATYRCAGIHHAPLSSTFDAGMVEQLRKVAGIEPDFASAVEEAFARNPDIPLSLCHGDLLPSNMCLSGDKFYLLDWDRSFEGAVVQDLLRLPMKYPAAQNGVAEAVLRALAEDLGGTPQTARDQMAVYVGQRIMDAPARADRYQAFWRTYAKA